MTRRLLAMPLAVSLLAACGGPEQPPGPPAVTCGNAVDVNSGPLVVNALPTCGTVPGFGINTYTFTGVAGAGYTVTVWTRSGDADLSVSKGATLIGISSNTPPVWIDVVVVPAGAAASYTVDVEDASFSTGSSYAVQVTSP